MYRPIKYIPSIRNVWNPFLHLRPARRSLRQKKTLKKSFKKGKKKVQIWYHPMYRPIKNENQNLESVSRVIGRHRYFTTDIKKSASWSHPCHPGDLRQGRAGQERFPGVNESTIVAALKGVPLVLDKHELSSGVGRLTGHIPVHRFDSVQFGCVKCNLHCIALICIMLVQHLFLTLYLLRVYSWDLAMNRKPGSGISTALATTV